MNFIKGAVICLGIMGASLPAHAAFQAIYEVLGVFDSGDPAGFGVATVFHCTNLTGNPANARVRVFGASGGPVGNTITRSIVGHGTRTFATHETELFTDADNVLATGSVTQGWARIFAETPAAIVCSADMLDAARFPPVFVAPRRMIRLPRSTSGGED